MGFKHFIKFVCVSLTNGSQFLFYMFQKLILKPVIHYRLDKIVFLTVRKEIEVVTDSESFSNNNQHFAVLSWINQNI